MSFILDSHALLWALSDKNKLSTKVIGILEDPTNTIYVSSVSFWEIALKFSLGKLDLFGYNPDDLPILTKEAGFDFLPLLPTEAAGYYNLNADWHKDPFDRMLIWQSISNQFILLSKDQNVARYASVGLKITW